MPNLLNFLQNLWRDGRAVLADPPQFSQDDHPSVLKFLAVAFHEDALSLAGPPPLFAESVAVEAALLTWKASWFLVRRESTSESMIESLDIPRCPGTPGAHASADLTLRFLPRLHQRALSISSEDSLVGRLDQVLRAWPLSGVLSVIDEAPSARIDFQGHFGLELRYTERWSAQRKPLWKPTFEALEFVSEDVHVG